ncbi:hypothetical protein F4824DRAFT_92307 [Ustulina deusta]|nr:hypothetical protein F4824DRAFT_92307 [Ustulina deusta]
MIFITEIHHLVGLVGRIPLAKHGLGATMLRRWIMICFLLALILHASPDGVLRYVFFLDRTFPTSADTQYTLCPDWGVCLDVGKVSIRCLSCSVSCHLGCTQIGFSHL